MRGLHTSAFIVVVIILMIKCIKKKYLQVCVVGRVVALRGLYTSAFFVVVLF